MACVDPVDPNAEASRPGGSRFDHSGLIEDAMRQAADASAWRERIRGSLTRTQPAGERTGSRTRDQFVDPGRFPAGTVLADRYRIIEMLGKGGMGEVYRVDDLKLGQSIALKFISRATADAALASDDMHHEVRIARQVSHPNVCRVYDIGEIEGHPFISMEYIDGENLGALLKRIGRLPPAKALDVARQLCAALAAAHDAGILHRDLKPTNVMIDGRGKVRITDFGLAGLAEQFQAGDIRAGTPAYMAPEQLAGREVSVRSDLYSLGLVLYEVFTGEHAFQLRNDSRGSRPTPTRPSRVVDDIDPQVERVILRCLERDPAQRPPSALAVAAALPGADPLAAALAAGETPSPEMVAAAGAVAQVSGRTALGAYVLVLVGVLTIAWLNSRAYLFALVPLPKPPQVLADHARAVIETLGHRSTPSDSACGFQEDAGVLRGLARDYGPQAWSRVAQRPGAIYFWYRESPEPLVARDVGGVVTADDPPPLDPGMLNIRLDPRGRLLELRVVPAPDPARAAPAPIDPVRLLTLAGLTPDDFRPSDTPVTPSVFCDTTAAWEGSAADFGDVPVRVEAGACGGRVNYFRISRAGLPTPPGPRRDWSDTALQASRMIISAISLFGGALLAWRNLRLGRGDRRGTTRIATYVFASYILVWLLLADHVASPDGEWDLFLRGVARALFFAVWAWVLYLALEPYVRRLWPDSIITWSRLLAGRWRDPSVGRDVLIGGLLGVVSQGVALADQFVPQWLGFSAGRPLPAFLDTLLGLRQATGQVLWSQVNACFQPMFALVIMLVFRVVLRSLHAGYAAVWLLFVAWLVLSRHALNDPALLVDLALFGPLVATWIYVLNRFGLLAAIAGYLFVSLLSYFPLSLDLAAWHAETSLLLLACSFALATFGFATSVRGRSVFDDEVAPA